MKYRTMGPRRAHFRTVKGPQRPLEWDKFAKRPSRDSESTAELLILVALAGAIGFGLFAFIITS